MDETTPDPLPRAGVVRMPRARLSAILAAAMLGLGALVGAAVGPAPASSNAASDAEAQVPRLLALLEARDREQAALAAAAAARTAAVAAPLVTPARARVRATPASKPATPAATTAPTSSEEAGTGETSHSTPSSASKLPAVTNVWLIELSGSSFAAAQAQPAAAPYIDTQAIPGGALLGSWSAISADALAGTAALAKPPAAGSPPPLLHQIVQPPCPEGAAGAGCAAETPGQLTTADNFLKETLATITATPAYKEHGLVVVTFATVAQPTEAGLPAGSSSATFTYQPPAGVLLLSPFARAGSKPAIAFDPASPMRSLEALLH